MKNISFIKLEILSQAEFGVDLFMVLLVFL